MSKSFDQRKFEICEITTEGEVLNTKKMKGRSAEEFILKKDVESENKKNHWRFLLGQHLVKGQWKTFRAKNSRLFRVTRIS